MKEIDDAPNKDALTDGIAEAVREVAEKREKMARWEHEYSRKRSRGRILLVSAACVAFVAFMFWRNPSEPVLKEPVLRGSLSYDAAIERIDSLIRVGDTARARERIMETRQAVAADTMDMFHSAEPKPSKGEIEYSRIIFMDILSRLDELEGKILTTNE